MTQAVVTSKKGLRLDHVEIYLGDQRLFAIDAAISPGEVLSLMGPSGIGKSTLINAISGFLSPHFTCRGHILLNGVDITTLPPEARHVGVLFQDPLLFPHFSVLQNIEFALAPGNRAKRRKRALELLDLVGVADCADRDPATLSGGQSARVALMRVIAAEPAALLLDEPFSKLDIALKDAVRELVWGVIRDRALPALLVTHDPADATAAAGRIVTL